jgi:hypothetical protein
MTELVGYGTLYDTHVHELLALLTPCLQDLRTVVVRSIDSARTKESLGGILRHYGIRFQIVNGNVCLSPSGVKECLSRTIFTGFDEVWVFRQEPLPTSLAEVPAATSDAVIFAEGVPGALTDVALSTECLLVLADGCGLNYLTTDRGIFRAIKTLEHGGG